MSNSMLKVRYHPTADFQNRLLRLQSHEGDYRENLKNDDCR